jgi:acyl carrier protein
MKPRGGVGTASALKRVQAAIHAIRPDLPLSRIRPGASLVADLGIDSLTLAQLSIALEDVFGQTIFLGDVLSEVDDPATITVGQLAKLLARKEP